MTDQVARARTDKRDPALRCAKVKDGQDDRRVRFWKGGWGILGSTIVPRCCTRRVVGHRDLEKDDNVVVGNVRDGFFVAEDFPEFCAVLLDCDELVTLVSALSAKPLSMTKALTLCELQPKNPDSALLRVLMVPFLGT